MELKQRPFAGLGEAIEARALINATAETIKAWQIKQAWRQHRQEMKAQKAMEVARCTARKAVEVTIQEREEAAASSHARAMTRAERARARQEALNRAKAATLARAAARARRQAMVRRAVKALLAFAPVKAARKAVAAGAHWAAPAEVVVKTISIIREPLGGYSSAQAAPVDDRMASLIARTERAWLRAKAIAKGLVTQAQAKLLGNRWLPSREALAA